MCKLTPIEERIIKALKYHSIICSDTACYLNNEISDKWFAEADEYDDIIEKLQDGQLRVVENIPLLGREGEKND